MKKILMLLGLISITSGCSVTSIQRTEADGTAFSARNCRVLWKSRGIEVTYQRAGNDVKAAARIDASGSDAAAIEAAAAGAARGATGK